LSPRYTLFALEKRTTPSSFKTSSVGELFAHDPRCIRLRNPCVLREGRCRCPWRGHAAAQDFNVVAPVEQTVTSYFEATGNTAAVNSVDLLAHVQGFVEEISHTDGAFVKKSAPLFTIEPEPHRLKVETAKSAVASAQAGSRRRRRTQAAGQPHHGAEYPHAEYDRALAQRETALTVDTASLDSLTRLISSSEEDRPYSNGEKHQRKDHPTKTPPASAGNRSLNLQT
jgi:multidrug efflux pump subunit AcrA (membrane-fusion protein)